MHGGLLSEVADDMAEQIVNQTRSDSQQSLRNLYEQMLARVKELCPVPSAAEEEEEEEQEVMLPPLVADDGLPVQLIVGGASVAVLLLAVIMYFLLF